MKNRLGAKKASFSKISGRSSANRQLKFHPKAKVRLKEHAEQYMARLIDLSIIIAQRENANEVQSSQIDHAVRLMEKEMKTKPIINDALKTFGGLLLGLAIPGYITTLQAGDNVLNIVYVLIGILGLLLFFIGFTRFK